jgi:hypothetical protein
LLPSGGFFVHGLPTLALHGRNSDSAGNYQFIDVESTVRMGFLPGITSSGSINPPEEEDSTGNYQLIDSDSGRQDQNLPKILRTLTILGSADSNLIILTIPTVFKIYT